MTEKTLEEAMKRWLFSLLVSFSPKDTQRLHAALLDQKTSEAKGSSMNEEHQRIR